ncbi:flagellar FliJ protein [Gracilibacillus ureilyticus]|uniref:Flagellar FliJ protein n=1 Tax=Gracilibacillus ureilyticus TaxID=531814 RepID=A0A1H9L4X3_9BACI|nr:flagellar export protein FliJ [Gracilibacillus ureilyticus]SER06388.1 flagellar FliJ protein [Gracilibacillus ureilyticus]
MKQWTGFEKIKSVRENEKNEIRMEFEDAQTKFEHEAKELYQLLKKKEAMETKYQECLQNGDIETVRGYYNYLHYITPNIIDVQKRVTVARENMNQVQQKLSDQYIEVKKIEKIIDRKKRKELAWINKQEIMLMDEISIRKFNQKQG